MDVAIDSKPRDRRRPTLRGTAGIVSWLHFGDLHLTTEGESNYQDFLRLVEDANRRLAQNVCFAVLPGDNADDGSEEQYRLVRLAVDNLQIPLYAIPGDHDRKSGQLDSFRRYLEPEPIQSFTLAEYKFVFLNSMEGQAPERFGFSRGQIEWLERELAAAKAEGLASILFMHTYPSELGHSSERVRDLLKIHRVPLVEMGHTHYNELANDGRTIYAATRSTGQIEEGPAGFSITNLDQGIVSWKFKPLGNWPFVMIT
ncbi:MAG: metallophosphoesterase, partial [Acidobacteriota bacterium]|nr:metallophosphoesterase [Acidobacteriota bacterium]